MLFETVLLLLEGLEAEGHLALLLLFVFTVTLVGFATLILCGAFAVPAYFWVVLLDNELLPTLKNSSLITLYAFMFLPLATLLTPVLLYLLNAADNNDDDDDVDDEAEV